MNSVITVVIPTYQRPDLLRNCLQALSEQQLPSWVTAEVFVIDDANDLTVADLTHEMARRSGWNIRYFGQPQRRGPAAARNRGWQAARSPFVAFTDDDCLPQPTWLLTGLMLLLRGGQVLTGRVRMPLPEWPTTRDHTMALLETAEFVTANLFCRRSALERVNGFEEQFDSAWREDSDLQFKLLEAGIPIAACPDAVIVHPIRPVPWYASLRDERKNRYDALLYKRHPSLFQQRIPTYRSIVLRYYGAVISLLIGVLAVMTGYVILAVAGFGLWLLLTLQLINQRLPARSLNGQILQQTVLVSLVTPFLSIYWRLYGAFKYRTWYW